MSTNRGRWQKGQSGNPSGRAKTERTLANILRETGEHDSYGELPNKNLMARLVWQAVAFGEVTLAGGKTYELSIRDWLDLIKWLNTHVDGSGRSNAAVQTVETEETQQNSGLEYDPNNVDYIRRYKRYDEPGYFIAGHDRIALRDDGFIQLYDLPPELQSQVAAALNIKEIPKPVSS